MISNYAEKATNCAHCNMRIRKGEKSLSKDGKLYCTGACALSDDSSENQATINEIPLEDKTLKAKENRLHHNL